LIEFQTHPKTVLVWVTLVIFGSSPEGNRRASRPVQWLCVVRTVTCVAVTQTGRLANPEVGSQAPRGTMTSSSHSWWSWQTPRSSRASCRVVGPKTGAAAHWRVTEYSVFGENHVTADPLSDPLLRHASVRGYPVRARAAGSVHGRLKTSLRPTRRRAVCLATRLTVREQASRVSRRPQLAVNLRAAACGGKFQTIRPKELARG